MVGGRAIGCLQEKVAMNLVASLFFPLSGAKRL